MRIGGKVGLGWCLSAALMVSAQGSSAAPPLPTKPPADVYATYGVHNDRHNDVCADPSCVYKRRPRLDPIYPAYWTSHWAMYRVFNHWVEFPPPYDHAPPKGLKEGQDYQKSWGVTYYDTTYKSRFGTGAMEEHYDKYCLPIFPIDNHYSCSFISLDKVAFFVTYADRPAWMPKVCLFSPDNHWPARDFIKHLPWSARDSMRVPGVDGYSFWIDNGTGKIMHEGVKPDETANGGVLFGYGFYRKATPDRVDKAAAPYPHPQSFYFSGVPLILPQVPLPNAPIVSQNYTDFAMVRPNPATTWDQVKDLDPAKLPKCQLFNPPPEANPHRLDAVAGPPKKIPMWGNIGRP
jgi:hypothetical protein